MVDSFPRQHARTQRLTLGAPRNFAVTDDGTVLFLRSKGPEDPVTCLWALDPTASDERLLADPAELLADHVETELPAAERARRERAREGAAGIVAFSADAFGRRLAYALAGRVYVTEVVSGETTMLDTADGVFDPRISPDGALVSFVVGDELHVVDADGRGAARSLAAAPDEHVSWGSAEFIAAEEMRRSRGHWWSPDSTLLAVARVDVSPVDVWHIADPAQPWREPVAIRYPAAGTANASVSLSLVDLDGGRRGVQWDAQQWPYLVDVAWAENQPLTLTLSSRDQRTMVVVEVDESGQPGSAPQACEVRRYDDPDWVDIVPGTPRRCGAGFLTVRERDGTRRLLLDEVALSPDHLWVRDVVSSDDSTVIFTASLDPTTVGVYRSSLTDPTAAPEVLMAEGGVASAVASGATRVEIQASMSGPTTMTVAGGSGGPGTRRDIANLAATPLVEPSVEFIEAGPDGVRTAVLMPSEQAAGPLPILMDPYGGPHAQRVLRSRNAFLASQWLADQGYCVVVADGRGTPGRGGNWERSVRGDLAGPVLDDQLTALDAVVAHLGDRVDAQRVAIRGWSFGGYLAALAVLRRPDRFHAAVAGAPVTDWRWYDTHYTERYLGHPDEEPENYEISSVIADAGKLMRPLLIIHGLADDNVVAAHSLQLSSALLAAGCPHEVLPLSGVTHMTPQEEVAENLLLLQVDFLERSLRDPSSLS